MLDDLLGSEIWRIFGRSVGFGGDTYRRDRVVALCSLCPDQSDERVRPEPLSLVVDIDRPRISSMDLGDLALALDGVPRTSRSILDSDRVSVLQSTDLWKLAWHTEDTRRKTLSPVGLSHGMPDLQKDECERRPGLEWVPGHTREYAPGETTRVSGYCREARDRARTQPSSYNTGGGLFG